MCKTARVVGGVCLAVAASFVTGCEKSGEAGTSHSAVVAEPVASPAPVKPAVATSAPAPAAAAEVDPYQIAFEPQMLNFGVVPPNQDSEGTIAIRNNGAEPVRILGVRPSCKCTTLNDLAGTVIEPGGAVTMDVALEGRAVTGPRGATIRVLIEGVASPYMVDVRAEVSLPVRMSPSILNLAGQTSGHVVVESIDGRPFNILAANGKPPVFVDYDPDMDAPQSSYILEWDLSEQKASGHIDRWWIVETDHPGCPLVDGWIRDRSTVRIPPKGRPWRLASMRSVLGAIEPGGSAEVVVHVKNINAPDAIYAVQSLSADFQAELVSFERRGVDAECTIRVTPSPGFTGVLNGTVELIATEFTARHDVLGKVG